MVARSPLVQADCGGRLNRSFQFLEQILHIFSDQIRGPLVGQLLKARSQMNTISVDMKKGVIGAAIALDFTFDCKYFLDLESFVHKQISVYMISCYLVNSLVIQV